MNLQEVSAKPIKTIINQGETIIHETEAFLSSCKMIPIQINSNQLLFKIYHHLICPPLL